MAPADIRHYKSHLIWPALLFCIAITIIEWQQIDLLLADYIYALQGDQWALKDHLITSTVLHEYAQQFTRLIAITILLLAISSHSVKQLKPYKKGLWGLFFSLATAAAIVAVIKSVSHVDCPWSLERYGGTRPYLSTFKTHPGNFEYGRCFPAGHASGGYGLIALYFFFARYIPRWRWRGLMIGISMGLIFGVAQQLRGAHFISHDIWTLAICWYSALIWDWWLHKP